MADERKRSASPFKLRGLYVHSSSTRIAQDFDPLIVGVSMHANFRIASQRFDVRVIEIERDGEKSEINTVNVVTRFEFRYSAIQPPKTDALEVPLEGGVLAEISAEIAADYQINQETEPTKEFISQWAARNVMLHTWPYWREYCASTLFRMNLPAIHMPMLILDPLVEADVILPNTVDGEQDAAK